MTRTDRPARKNAGRDLARVRESDALARVVPYLAPEVLHQLIRHRGLEGSAELVTSATPAQLTSILDLDLWRPQQAGRDDTFDTDRFGEWLALLADVPPGAAGKTLAAMDQSVVVAGLSRYIRVFDPGIFLPAAEDMEPIPRSAQTPEFEIGGYVIRARRPAAWDAVIAVLVALDAEHPDCFHGVMRGCRRLSNSRPEVDGLDDLLMAPEQLLHNVSLDREARRTQQGYLTPADARAFLEMARQPHDRRPRDAPSLNGIAAAYFRAVEEAEAAARTGDMAFDGFDAAPPDLSDSLEVVAEVLAEAGLTAVQPRALLTRDASQQARFPEMQRLMDRTRDTDLHAYFARSRELAFLVNVLMSGGSVQSRPFTAREASDAAVAVCNLGLEQRPGHEPEDLLAVFEKGWETLHRDVSLFVADSIIVILADAPGADEETRRDVYILRREMMRHRKADAPWRAKPLLEVIATLDVTAWAALTGLLDECPVVSAALSATLTGSTAPISPTAFEFISTARQIDQIRRFMAELPSRLA